VPNKRQPLPALYLTLAAAIGIGAAIIANAGAARCAVDDLRFSVPPQFSAAPQFGADSRAAPGLAQDDDEDADSEVPSDQVEKYVAVYKDMQRDRNLTVETAAAKEGLTVAEFRDLEDKISRDDAAREHVRTELQAAASEKR
jgi:hypothetical protein